MARFLSIHRKAAHRWLLAAASVLYPAGILWAGIGLGVVPKSSAPASSTLTSFSLVNTSGSAVNAIVSPFIGLQFKKGDLPSGMPWPKFIRDDTSAACVYSWGLKTTWSDGSVKHLSVVVRCPSTIAGNATLKVDVQTAGTQPTTSTRTTAEICGGNCSSPTAADIVQMVATGSINLSGTWNATLPDTIANGTCNVWLDGDAGKGWICDGDYKQSGSAHGQLRARWYVFSITDGSGNLGGIRYLSRTWQPYYDIDSPAKNVRVFSTLETCTGVTSTTCSGGTAIAIPYVYAANAFTWVSGNTFTATGNNFNSGAADTNTVPVTLSTTGTLPTGLSTGTVYYATVPGAGSATVTLETTSAGTGAANATGAGSGTHTMTPVLAVQHFGTIFNATAGTSGQTTSGGQGGYNFSQDGGSLTADATLRFTKDQTYWHGTKVLPPWDNTIAALVPTWSFNWDPVTVGPATTYLQQSGQRFDLGALSAYAALHFYEQGSAASAANQVNAEKVIRVFGMAGADMNVAIRQCAISGGACTKFAPPNVGNPSNTYTGFTASNYATNFVYDNAELVGSGNTFPVGNQPPTTSVATTWQGTNWSHMPNLAYYPYVWSGEPQYLDILEEMGNEARFAPLADVDHRNPCRTSCPGTSDAFGVTTGFNNELRYTGWSTRDLVLIAGIAPDTSPDGVAWQSYFKDGANDSIAWLNTVIANIPSSGYFATNGYHSNFDFNGSSGGFIATNNSIWQEMYLMSATNFAAALLESSAAVTFANNKGLWWTHQTASFGDATRYSEEDLPAAGDDGTGHVIDPITSDVGWGMVLETQSLSWTPSGFTEIVGTGGLAGFIPGTGDKIIFVGVNYNVAIAVGNPPTNFNPYQGYYACNVVNTSGTTYTFTLSDSSSSCAAGHIVAPGNTSSVDTAAVYTVPVNLSSLATYHTAIDGYVSAAYNGGLWAQAIGANSSVNHTVTDANTRLTNGGTYNCNTSTQVEYCMQSSY